ncbi:MAG: hypothetical protein KAH07_08515 [Flavobacteriaceae bacterium]|nr:hypothetical protein [Flavobacteriaceae bacterium]
MIKRILFIAVITVTIISCTDSKKKSEETEGTKPITETTKPMSSNTRFEKIDGYFVKNTVVFEKSVKYIAVSSQEEFDTVFGIAKTMKNKVTPLDFEKFNVAAILNIPSKKSDRIKLQKYTSSNGIMTVGYDLEKGSDQTFDSGDLLIFKIPKGITKINFESEGQSETINVN